MTDTSSSEPRGALLEPPPGLGGATVATTYHSARQDVIPVSTDTLEDIRDSGLEEFWQFAIAEFFIAGCLWVGVEKLFNWIVQDSENATKPLSPFFWVCLMGVIMGLCVAISGYRQMSRKHSKVDKLIKEATKAKDNPNDQSPQSS